MLDIYCRMCGLDQEEPTRNDKGSPSYMICLCCGTEAGYDDERIDVVRKRRQEWLDNGAQWFVPEKKPSNWNLEEQLKNIPPEWL